MEHNYIKDFKFGQMIDGLYLIKGVKDGETQRGSKYMFVEVGDKTGSLRYKIWDVTSEEEAIKENIGSYLHLQGKVTSYQNQLEITGEHLALYTSDSLEKFGLSADMFAKVAPVTVKDMMGEIVKVVNDDIKNDEIKKIIQSLINKFLHDFRTFPAGRSMHHDYMSGLLYHTYTMLKTAKALVSVYGEEILDTDVLYGGIIAHDVGKVKEYMMENGSYEFSQMGVLMGHISLIYGELVVICKELDITIEDNTKVQALLHVVLSHHGKLEWGSPVKPTTAEAHLVHFIDMIDSRMDLMTTELRKIEVGTVSGRIFGLDKTPLLRHK